METRDVVASRRSTRAFTQDPISSAQIRELLEEASWCPSGGNVQPWKVIAVSGKARNAVADLASSLIKQGAPSEEGAHPVYPKNLWEPYRTYRYENGEEMYAALGISREDKTARLEWLAQNFDFFGAPAGLFFILDCRMGSGQWAHLGMFIQTLMLLAHDRGLATCPQEAWARFRDSLATHFDLGEDEIIYCGMALGYADTIAPVNTWIPSRAPVESFARFEGF